MKIIVSFSGGKDSQACLIHACEEFGANNIEAVFCDTGWEHHLTYNHVHEVTTQLGVKLVLLKNKRGGFEDLCTRMKWFPDSKNRMCTLQLKIQPMIDYILSIDDDVLIIQGIRAAESVQRSKLACSGDYFSEYFEEHKKQKVLYRKQDVRTWATKHHAIVDRPLFGLSAQQIIDYILIHHQKPNPLYTQGFSRVGCYPCIYARLSDIRAMRKDDFYVQRVINLENSVNEIRTRTACKYSPASLFFKGKIPAQFCRKYGNDIPAFEDVLKYVSREDAQLDLFEPQEGYSCMSLYHGLCE